MTNNYWMHRITCGENASPYAQHLFFGNGNDFGYKGFRATCIMVKNLRQCKNMLN